MSTELIKQDINFLEFPLWLQDSQMAHQIEEGYIWQDREGFVYRTGYKPPVKIDLIFLLYLLLKSQQTEWKEELDLTRFEILAACSVGTSKNWYARLEESLKRWTSVVVEFEGTFYDGTSYQIMQFHIVDDWELEKN